MVVKWKPPTGYECGQKGHVKKKCHSIILHEIVKNINEAHEVTQEDDVGLEMEESKKGEKKEYPKVEEKIEVSTKQKRKHNEGMNAQSMRDKVHEKGSITVQRCAEDLTGTEFSG